MNWKSILGPASALCFLGTLTIIGGETIIEERCVEPDRFLKVSLGRSTKVLPTGKVQENNYLIVRYSRETPVIAPLTEAPIRSGVRTDYYAEGLRLVSPPGTADAQKNYVRERYHLTVAQVFTSEATPDTATFYVNDVMMGNAWTAWTEPTRPTCFSVDATT